MDKLGSVCGCPYFKGCNQEQRKELGVVEFCLGVFSHFQRGKNGGPTATKDMGNSTHSSNGAL